MMVMMVTEGSRIRSAGDCYGASARSREAARAEGSQESEESEESEESGGSREAGSILIIALGVLALIAILGTAFAQLMRLERRATENYVEGRRMELLLDSALDRVVASLHGAKNYRSFTVYQDTPWLHVLERAVGGGAGEKDLAHGRADVNDQRVGRWELFSQREGHRGSYKTKVIDCSAQINLNGRQDTLVRMLDNLGEAIEKSSRLKLDGKKVRNPFYTGPNGSGQRVRGADIVRLRRLLPGGKFTSKTQLRWIIGPENYETLKDFVTCHSWEDPYTYGATDGLEEVPILQGAGSRGAGGRAVGGGGGQEVRYPAADSPRVSHEPRHPININTAPEEVLIACLQGLAGRRIFPYSKLGAGGGSLAQVDANAQVQGERVIGQEEFQNVLPRTIFVYSARLEYEHAKKIAEEIIRRRKITPFMAWRTNDPRFPGFEDFVDSLDAGFFPSPGTARAIDPDQPQVRAVHQEIVTSGRATPVGRLWAKGHGEGQSAERLLRRQRGLAVHSENAWYYDLIKGVVKANFNPNTRLNRYNPNPPAYVPVDKSDLVWLQNQNSFLKGYTTEFCFDTMGIYEVTALGSIEELGKTRLGAAAAEPPGVPYVEPAGPASQAQVSPFEQRPFERKMQTIVKVFEVLRHTSQHHFEKPFISPSRSSKNDRQYVVTHPEPMNALTEIYAGGSPRDGRVELAGLQDGKRLQTPLQSRSQLYKTHPGIIMAHGLQDRDPPSVQRLQRALRGAGVNLLGDEVSAALREVLDANYSRLQSINRKAIRRKELQDLGGVINGNALHHDVLVRRESDGCDLQPDGLHTGLTRMQNLESRLLVLPARQRVGDASSLGGNALVGASGVGSRGQNILGNVPYYDGGLAFWVKFEFDGDDPVFCGLIGYTQVIKEVQPNAADYSGSEGSQFFIFKNSLGQLRIVRMYYHQAFLESGGAEGDGGGGEGDAGIKLYPDATLAGGQGGGGGGGGSQRNPILDHLDLKKIISRADILVPVAHFKAHEWHHIAVDWNDANPTYPIRLYIDFEEVREGGVPRRAQAVVDGQANSWVRLNERQPRDRLEVGGFLRNQGVADAGIFKWFTNTSSGATGGGSRGVVVPVDKDIKRILANATIDELVTYEGEFAGVKQYYAGSGSPGYYTNQVGEYANVFEIALPPDVDNVVLRSLDWTSYYPVMHTDSRLNSPAQLLRVTPITCELSYLSSVPPPPPFQEAWRTPTVPNRLGGRRVLRGGTKILGENAEVVYKLRLEGAIAQSGATAGGRVQSPVVDDVTLTYYLTSPKILMQEEVE